MSKQKTAMQELINSFEEKMYTREEMIRFGAFMQQRHTGVKESLEWFEQNLK